MKNIMHVCMSGIVLLIVFYCPPCLKSGELRPFVLPSTKFSGQMQQQEAVQQRPEPETPSVYKQFAEDVKKMTPEQKQEFRERYQYLYGEAVKSGNTVEMDYYNNLLVILNR